MTFDITWDEKKTWEIMADAARMPRSEFLKVHGDVAPEQYPKIMKAVKEFRVRDKAEQDVLMSEFKGVFEKHFGKPFEEIETYYTPSNIARIVKLDCGRYTVICKPNIGTSFCFGYDTFGPRTSESAWKCVDAMHNDGGKNFKRKNMEEFLRIYRDLNGDTYFGKSGFVSDCYWRYDFGEDVYGYVMLLGCGERQAFDCDREYGMKEGHKYIQLTDNDVENLKKAYRIEAVKFDKKLNAYLKKYGTAKLHTWAYCADD